MPLRLGDQMPGAQVACLIGREAVRIVSAQMMGESCDLVYRDRHCDLRTQILLLGNGTDLDLVADGRKRRIRGGGCDKIPLIPEGGIRYGYQ